MKAKSRILSFALPMTLAWAGLLFAGTTGKIAGKISDAATREALISANILIKGTNLGTVSSLDGTYTVNNVAPGTYAVVVSMMGFQRVEYRDVQVNIDLTTRLDVAMQPKAVDLETTVIIAQRNLVIKDMTSSLATTSAEQIAALPVNNVQQVLRLNAGIIESDGRLHIRGGRPGEVAYWVDGISATDMYDGRMSTTVENSAIQELQVISGTFNAEYGQAMSGIVNIVTKEGGEAYSGQIKAYAGDYVSTDDRYGLYKSLQTQRNPLTGLTQIVSSERDEPLKKFNPIYNGEGSLSGPVPFIGKSLSFFANGRFYSEEGYFYGRNWFRPNGTPGDSSLIAMNPYQNISLQGKLRYQFNPTIRMSYNLFWNRANRDRNFFRFSSADYQGFNGFNVHDYKYVPNGLPKYESGGFNHIFTLNHVLSKKTFYELRVNRYDSESKQYLYKDPTTAIKYLVSVQEDTANGIAAETFDPFTDEGAAKLQSITLLGGKYSYVPDPNGPDGYIHPDLIHVPTSYSFMNKGMDIAHIERSTAYWAGKLDVTSQISRVHEIKFGTEARQYKMILHSYQIVPETDGSGQEITPFRPAVPEVGSIFRNDYEREPMEMSAYAQDKIEFNNIILNAGLRYDYFDPNASMPVDPADPNIYSPFKNKNIYAGWVDMPANSGTTLDQYIRDKVAGGEFREYTPEERRAFMQKKVGAKMSVSPRLGISFPITDRGVIHFSYGHFLQIPEFQFLYSNPDFKLTSGSGTTLFGNPDLRPQKTVMYELGLQQQLSNDISIDMTIFYRDVRDWVGSSPTITTAKTAVEYSQYENKDYSNVRGITFKVERRFTNNYSFRADYSMQIAEGTYSNPADAYNAMQSNQAPVLALVPMGWDQRHTLNAQIIYRISKWTASLIGRYWSGRPYTPSFPVSEAVGGSSTTGLTINSARRPAQKSVDLTLNRAFSLGPRHTLEFFVNVYNLFDQRDATAVYADTGTPEYTTNIKPGIIPYSASRVSTVEDYTLQPSWYTAPRQVQIGFIFGFK